MKIFIGLLFATSPIIAQQCAPSTAYETLDANNLSVGFRNGGDMFWDGSLGKFIHKYDSAATFYAAALWIGGFDGGHNLRFSAQRYRTNGNDYWAGPLDASGGVTDSACAHFDHIWKVDRAAIDALRLDFMDNGVVDNAPDMSLQTWPGKGNPLFLGAMGFALPNADLAPFYDQNTDAVYNPYDGDYPVYEHGNANAVASQMLWSVFNDNGNTHTEFGAQPLLVEVQLTAYAFDCSTEPILQNTIFTKHKIISRNTVPLNNVRIGLWADFDLGCATDDYMGCIPALNSTYAYNSYWYDYDCGGSGGFGARPPVQSTTILNRDVYKIGFHLNGSDPSTAMAAYNMLDGRYSDSTQWMYGFPLAPIDFMYPDTPGLGGATMLWTSSDDDHRATTSLKVDTLAPGAIEELDIAYTYHRDTSRVNVEDMVQLVFSEVPVLQQMYDNGFQLPCTIFSSTQEVLAEENKALWVYPNPNRGQFVVANAPVGGILTIIDALGRIIYTQNISEQQTNIQMSGYIKGVYFLQTQHNGQLSTVKLVIAD